MQECEAGTLLGSRSQQGAPQARTSEPQALTNQDRVGCHNQRTKTADLLRDRAGLDNPAASAEVWEKVIRKLHAGALPPTGMLSPDQTNLDSFVQYLEISLDRAAVSKPNPASPARPDGASNAASTRGVETAFHGAAGRTVAPLKKLLGTKETAEAR